ncbi:MAG: 3-phosphoshikimate 1-carboxyvinyltransferase [Proteobacteria bacterium]|nr:3-phosphoshikimate 1-carboxyvinyltransferase [Pseudomonadota bacterium]MBU4469486.1 3-phosphoshikimate 1-carboxyvinyltransferase [Pseudomonadota bacterium]MCG2752385.1 3-phosphoshikimate 1-carboxyvinyltransferase [Desulfobacteraceae bacterium]
MIEIKPTLTLKGEVAVPGSKSYSHRILIASALSNGICRIENLLDSEDTRLTRSGLRQMGIAMEEKNGQIIVHGKNGLLAHGEDPIYLGNSGTSMRLLTGIAALGQGKCRLTGTDRMHQRPIQDLLDALNLLGINARSENGNGCPPVLVQGGEIQGGRTRIKSNVSSQYLSSLLLMAPKTGQGLSIEVSADVVSKPYVDMTVDIMTRMGISLERDGYREFKVPGGQVYRSGNYYVEPDCSQAGYFWAMAAVTGNRIKVKGVNANTRQGDVRFAEVLKQMGCRVDYEADGIAVTGGPLKGITVDMGNMPDIVPTLGVVAAFAQGETVIQNVAHLKEKESDRLAATSAELNRIGISTEVQDAGLIVKGGTPHGGTIKTYDDHRMAMSFSVAGLRVPGIFIEDEHCVEKSFPTFWEVFQDLCTK